MPPTERASFDGYDLTLAADVAGPPDGLPILFLPGGGQTRQSWGAAIEEAARRGYRGIAIDMRGHGESGWAPDGCYEPARFVADIRRVIGTLERVPVIVGASLGGITGMMIAADPPPAIAALVLVDVTPRIDTRGAVEIAGFMSSAPNGFASLDEAADAVAAYLPHRPRPKDTSGLLKNLRLREDGRYHWHWDPAFMSLTDGVDVAAAADARMNGLEDAARRIAVPTLLVRGANSRIVGEEQARAFHALVPHAEQVDVAGAHHMVAGDANDTFNAAVFDFIARVTERAAPPGMTTG